MIGRAAQGRPWIFDDMVSRLEKRALATPRDANWVRELLLEHLESIYGFYGSEHGVRLARKHIVWYSKNHHGSGAFRAKACRVETPLQQKKLVREFFSGLEQETQEVLAA